VAQEVKSMKEPSFACSLTDERLRVRLNEWLALDERALLRAEDHPNGQVRVYRAGAEIERVLAELIEAEGRCCPFLDFTVRREADDVRLTVHLAEEARSSPVVQIIQSMGRSARPPAEKGG
jgi:hypothetical protein